MRKPRFNERDWLEFYTLKYVDGLTLKDICELTGFSSSYIERMFKRITDGEKVCRHEMYSGRTKAMRGKLIKMREAGMTYREIGETVNLAHGYIHKIINEGV